MQRRAFFDNLKRIARDPEWTAFKDRDGALRLRYKGTPCDCPITAVCWYKTGVSYPPEDYWAAKNLLNLDLHFTKHIVYCADHQSSNMRNQQLRKRLFDIFGLEQ